MEEEFDLDLNKLKKMQVDKIKKNVINLINDNSDYYMDKEYAKKVLDGDKKVRDYNSKKKMFENENKMDDY